MLCLGHTQFPPHFPSNGSHTPQKRRGLLLLIPSPPSQHLWATGRTPISFSPGPFYPSCPAYVFSMAGTRVSLANRILQGFRTAPTTPGAQSPSLCPFLPPCRRLSCLPLGFKIGLLQCGNCIDLTCFLETQMNFVILEFSNKKILFGKKNGAQVSLLFV